MNEKKVIGPRVGKAAEAWLEERFRTRTAGAEYILGMMPRMYARTMEGLKGKFTRAELRVMVEVGNGLELTPGLAGQHLEADCADGMALDGLGEKYGVQDGEDFLLRVALLTDFERACLEIWANGYWYGRTGEEREDLYGYIDKMDPLKD